MKWSKELESGLYYERLLPGGFVKEEDQEPTIEGLEFFYDAFRELDSCRPVGLELGPIPFTAIVEYSRIYDVGDFDEFLQIIRLVDAAYLRIQRKKAEKSSGEKNGGKHPNKNNSSKS